MMAKRKSGTDSSASQLPQTGRADADVAGHWLLARLGKRVLRPGGLEMTHSLLAHAAVAGADVVELAPGLGRTARDILDRGPRSYVGVDADPQAAACGAAAAGMPCTRSRSCPTRLTRRSRPRSARRSHARSG